MISSPWCVGPSRLGSKQASDESNRRHTQDHSSEYGPGRYDVIADACNRSDEAVGFNYNGYLKGDGGRLKRCEDDNRWLKDGIVCWVCIKTDRLHRIPRDP